MSILFEQPALLLLLVIVPVVWLFRGARRDWKHSLIRSLVVALVVVAMAQPVTVRFNQDAHAVFVLDDSESSLENHDGMIVVLREAASRLPADAKFDIIQLGESDLWSLPGQLSRLRRVHRLAGRSSASSLSRGLQLAGQLIPRKSRGAVTVISDGLATDDDWSPALQTLSQRAIPVHTIRVPIRTNDVYPIAVQSRQAMRVGETARLQIGVVGTTTKATLVVTSDGKELARIDDLSLDERANLNVEFEPERAGIMPVTVELIAANGDRRPNNNRLTRFLAVQEPLRILYAGQRLQGAVAGFQTLIGRGFQLDEWTADEIAESQQPPLETLRQYDAVVLDDISAAALTPQWQEALAQAVRKDGVGLLMTGGQSSFGPGGFHRTAIAEILPVEFIQKEEKRDPSTTLVVIIDTSGSMTGQRVQLAKEVARLAMRRLLPHDKVGIVEFYGAKRWAAPIQPASNSIELQRAINRLDAGGGTVILPAIEESFYALQNVQTRYKHVLVLTDGGVERGAFESLLRKMAEKGINVSTVLVGGDAHSEFLVNLANWGKGRFYSASNRFSLPEVILKQPTTARIPAYRPGSHALLGQGGRGWWGTVDKSQIPPVAGYVETKARANATTLIRTQQGQHPLLTSWQSGLGRVTCFTTEPTGPGTATWRDWKPFGTLMARWLRRTARTHATPFDFSLQRRWDRLIITADQQVDGTWQPEVQLLTARPNDQISPAAIRPDAPNESVAANRALSFRRVTPMRYQAEAYFDPQQVAWLKATAGPRSPSQWHLVSSPHEDIRTELQVDPEQVAPLEQWSTETGGSSIGLSQAGRLRMSVGGNDQSLSAHKIWPWLLFLALLTYLADILYRRWPRTSSMSLDRAS